MIKGMLSGLSPIGKLLLFVGLLVSLLIFSTLLSMLVLVPFMGTNILTDIARPDYTNPAMVDALKAMQIISMAGGLLLPALLYILLTEKSISGHLVVRRTGISLLLLAGVLLIIVGQPVIGYSYEWNSQLKLPSSLAGLENWMRSMEDDAAHITDAFLGTVTIGGFLMNLFMIALLPAFAEEILFRGVLARLLRDWTGSMHLAVVLSALIFAGVHMQFFGFLPRFLLGMGLGYLYFWSGNIWVPIAAHFTNNLLSVVVEFLYKRGMTSMNSEQFGSFEGWGWVAGSILLTSTLLYYIYKHRLIQVREVQ